jgi:hypothetical protein
MWLEAMTQRSKDVKKQQGKTGGNTINSTSFAATTAAPATHHSPRRRTRAPKGTATPTNANQISLDLGLEDAPLFEAEVSIHITGRQTMISSEQIALAAGQPQAECPCRKRSRSNHPSSRCITCGGGGFYRVCSDCDGAGLKNGAKCAPCGARGTFQLSAAKTASGRRR